MNSEMSNSPKTDQISDYFSSKSPLQDFVKSSLGFLGIMFFSRISLLFFKPFFCNLRWCRLPALQCRCFRGKRLTEKISWEVYTWKLTTNSEHLLSGLWGFRPFLCKLLLLNCLYIFTFLLLREQITTGTDVRFASFFSGGFITAIVVNPSERKLAKCTSVQKNENHCGIVISNYTLSYLSGT